MCEWLKKIFGCKCSCKHCHCGEENKEEVPASAEILAEVAPEEPSAPAEEISTEIPAEEPKDEVNSL